MNLSVRSQYWRLRTSRLPFQISNRAKSHPLLPFPALPKASSDRILDWNPFYALSTLRNCSHLSPYTRWRFLLGLPPGVISLCFPASSNSFKRALLSALGSTASAFKAPAALSLRAPFCSIAFLSDFLFSAPGGGVTVRGGVATGGVFKEFAALAGCPWRELNSSLVAMLVDGCTAKLTSRT